MKRRRQQIRIWTFIVSRFSKNMTVNTVSKLEVLGLSGFRRDIACHIGICQCIRTSGQYEVFDRNWRLPSSGWAASQLLSYFTLKCTNSKSSSKSRHGRSGVSHFSFLFSTFDFFPTPTSNIKRVFCSQRQKQYCERLFMCILWLFYYNSDNFLILHFFLF